MKSKGDRILPCTTPVVVLNHRFSPTLVESELILGSYAHMVALGRW